MADTQDSPVASSSHPVHNTKPAFSRTFRSLSPDSLAEDSHETFLSGLGVKQKRKRTSPQDHAILESAYQSNPKPDRKERLQIVSQVNLDEKGVQIWFQNRRQNDRRRSRPLLPHELVPHLQNTFSLGYVAIAQATSRTSNNDPGVVLSIETDQGSAKLNSDSAVTLKAEQLETIDPSIVVKEITPRSSDGASKGIDTDPAKSTSVSNGRKRSYSDMKAPSGSKVTLDPVLHASTSTIRLSMTADGSMKVKTSLEDTPSPPKERAPAPKRLSEKVKIGVDSVATDEDVFRSSTRSGRSPLLGNTGLFGRSRDVRTWEFYCDSGSRDSLVMHAEAENKGSATSAIALMRSSTQKSKQNALSRHQSAMNGNMSTTEVNGKPKLLRAKSSMARLAVIDMTGAEKTRKFEANIFVDSHDGDSDKENWAPGSRSAVNLLRRTQPSNNTSRALDVGDHTGNSRQDRPRVDRSARRPTTRPTDGALDSENRSPGKNKGEELDCVQGLLSLSQGAWR